MGVQVYPTWALLDADGKVVRVVKGSLNDTQLLALLENPQADLRATKTSFSQPNQRGKTMNTHTIYLAGGCFWGLEAYFQRIDGVIDAASGYANGNTQIRLMKMCLIAIQGMPKPCKLPMILIN